MNGHEPPDVADQVASRAGRTGRTAATRMLEGGRPLLVVASILGWSPSTAARMAKRYCHIGNVAQMNAVEMLMVDCAVDESDTRGHKRGTANRRSPSPNIVSY